MTRHSLFWIVTASAGVAAEDAARNPPPFGEDGFRWNVSAPLISPVTRAEDPCYSVKDPSIVRFQDRWHLFCTIRSEKRSHQIEYLNFKDWPEAKSAKRHVLALSNAYFCAPQVFYFTPHRRWYLVHQVIDQLRTPALQPAFSTSVTIGDPASWSPPQLLFAKQPSSVKAWIDFWVICDDSKAHLFFTSNNGLMWRAETRLGDFPGGWNEPVVVLRDDIFEASHTYRLKGSNHFLTVIEAQGENGRRYYKAYLADRLDGEWKPLAVTRESPFASAANVRETASHWTDSISHGELLRSGHDEHLEINPTGLKFLFQGVSDPRRAGKKYGEIPWELGLLEARSE